jgi:hypothetical protein
MQEFLLFVALSQSGACKTVSRLADTNEPLRNIDRKMFVIDMDMPSIKIATARGFNNVINAAGWAMAPAGRQNTSVEIALVCQDFVDLAAA